MPSAHTEHDGQSETDSQSQTSDGGSSTLDPYRKAAQVRAGMVLPSFEGRPDTWGQNGRRFYSKIRFWFPFGIIRGCPYIAWSFDVY